jgi:hypothetical protein
MQLGYYCHKHVTGIVFRIIKVEGNSFQAELFFSEREAWEGPIAFSVEPSNRLNWEFLGDAAGVGGTDPHMEIVSDKPASRRNGKSLH